MDAVTPSSQAADIEAEISRLAEQTIAKTRLRLQAEAEQIRGAVSRLTSNSVDGLEGLMSELQCLREFLKCEGDRVRGKIESALAGINVIVDTIAPWKALSVPVPPAPTNSRPALRYWPAGRIEGVDAPQLRR